MRQQIWTFLHFPFHMALVLLMEGINQFVSWRHIIEFMNDTLTPLATVVEGTTKEEYISMWNATINNIIFETKLPVTEAAYQAITTEFAKITDPNISVDEADNVLTTVLVELLKIVFDGYGFEPPAGNAESTNALEIINAYIAVFNLVFGYFFISAGLVLIFLAVLSWLSHSKGMHESRTHMVGIVSKFVLGTALVLCSTMVLTEAADNLGSSPWTLPFLFFILAIALILNHVPWGNFGKSDGLPTNNSSKPKTLPWAILKKSMSKKHNY